MKTLRWLLLAFGSATLPMACSNQQSGAEAGRPDPAVRVIARGTEYPDLTALAALLAAKRVVFIGEVHDRYDHHLNQTAIIQQLYQQDPRLTIVLEMFPQPSQPYLDAYVAGELDEQAMLAKTGYFEGWGLDYRLYRPILQYAREQGIPLLALNVPRAIVRKVGKSGLGSLTEEEGVWAPAFIDKSDQGYRERLEAVYRAHEPIDSGKFEYFLEAQLLWDEAMAERAARYLVEHPDRRLAVLAGNGHFAYGSGIPQRLQRRTPAAAAIVLQVDEVGEYQEAADFLVVSADTPLKPAGRLGVEMEEARGSGLRIKSVMPGSAAEQAGVRAQDYLAAIGGRSINSLQDVRLALLDKAPGESVEVKVRRGGDGDPPQALNLEVILQEQ